MVREQLKKDWEREIQAKKLQSTIGKTITAYQRKIQDCQSVDRVGKDQAQKNYSSVGKLLLRQEHEALS